MHLVSRVIVWLPGDGQYPWWLGWGISSDVRSQRQLLAWRQRLWDGGRVYVEQLGTSDHGLYVVESRWPQFKMCMGLYSNSTVLDNILRVVGTVYGIQWALCFAFGEGIILYCIHIMKNFIYYKKKITIMNHNSKTLTYNYMINT